MELRLPLSDIRSQRGAVLGVALFLLTVLTLLALGASQLGRSHLTVSNSMQQRALSLQAAEAALRGAERLLDLDDQLTSAPCSSQRCRIYAFDQLRERNFRAARWWETYAWAYSPGKEWVPSSSESRAASFVIEELDFIPDSMSVSSTPHSSGYAFYRVTARAQLDAGITPVVLQSTYARRVNQ